MTRRFWVLVHRYAGLAMTFFLIIVGLTGSLLAFYSELEHLINPYLVVEKQNHKLLSPVELIYRAEQFAPEAQATSIFLSDDGVAQVSVQPRIDPLTKEPYNIDYDQVSLNSFTGDELGRREWGAITQGIKNLMPFIYKLHYELAIGDIGIWILGINALIWTLDSFVGFYLTLPKFHRTGSSEHQLNHPSYWQRWKTAWRIKKSRLNFDLHRASGLWLWIILVIFAWSSVYMDLWDTVYASTTRLFFEYHEPWLDIPVREQPIEQPKLTWSEAESIGKRLMNEAAQHHQFRIERVVALNLDDERGTYVYRVRSSRDIQDRNGSTRVIFDASTGELRMLLLPTGQYNGNTITSWLAALHMANIFGLPYRIFVCILGLVIVMLSVTGVIIWLRKRRSKKFHERKVELASI